MTFEDFINRIPNMDEKDISDYIEANARDIQHNPDFDEFVVRMAIKISEKLNIRDFDWISFYLKLTSSQIRYDARQNILQLLI